MSAFTVTCDTCHHSGSMKALELHQCHVQENGGRCEDFPACGHTDGDGCQTLPEHTAEYRSDMLHRFPDMDLFPEG